LLKRSAKPDGTTVRWRYSQYFGLFLCIWVGFMNRQFFVTLYGSDPGSRLVRKGLVNAARWFAKMRDIALPSQCALCGNLSHSVLCAGCDEQYWNQAHLRCAVCALPMPVLAGPGRDRAGSQLHCRLCMAEPPHFDATIALGDYRAPLDTLALELKFHARLAGADEFARQLRAMFEDTDSATPDIVAPVPLSRKRLRTRGYNQAWCIGKPLARRLGARADATLIERTRDTAPQAKLDLDTRRHNVGDAFKVLRDVRGKHVGVVDDVMTSGATLDALARTLKTAGARRVTNFVALRTPQD
jgi:ComF family protein